MAAFLRKKLGSDAKNTTGSAGQHPYQDQYEWSSAPSLPSTSTAPPLFAKFATTAQTRPTAGPSSRIVSAPMPLSNGHRRRTESNGERGQIRPQQPPGSGAFSTGSRDHDHRVRQAPSQATLPANYDHQGAPVYSQRHPLLRVTNATVDQQRPAQPSSRPMSNAVDKPLPLPAPDVSGDLLISRPPQPAIPENRRISASFTNPSKALPTPMETPSSTYAEKPLPLPQITPPASSPSRPVQQYFDVPQATSRTQPDKDRDIALPSAPIKHIASYPLIVPRVPASAKSLPPHPQESPSTPVSAPPPVVPSTSPPQPAQQYNNRHHRQAADFETIYAAYSYDFTDDPTTRTEQSPPKAPELVEELERRLAEPLSEDIRTIHTKDLHNNAHSQSPSSPQQQSAWLSLHADAFRSTNQISQDIKSSPSNTSLSHTNASPSHPAMNASTNTLPSTPSNSGKSHHQFTPPAWAPAPGPFNHPPDAETSRPIEPAFQPILPLQPRKASSMRTPDRNNNSQYSRIAPIRGKPLIFAAMATMDQGYESKPSQPPVMSTPIQPNTRPNETAPSLQGEEYANSSQQRTSMPIAYNPLYSHVINTFNPARQPSLSRLPSQEVQRPAVDQPQTSRPPAPAHTNSLPARPSSSRKHSKSGLAPTPPPPSASAPPATTVPPSRTPPPRTPPPRTPEPERQHRSTGSRSNHGQSPHRLLSKARPPGSTTQPQATPSAPDVSSSNGLASGDELNRTRSQKLQLIDEDPFARSDGVRMLKPPSRDGRPPPSRDGALHGQGEETRVPVAGVQVDRTDPGTDLNASTGMSARMHTRTPPGRVTTPGLGEGRRGYPGVDLNASTGTSARMHTRTPPGRATTPGLAEGRRSPWETTATPTTARAAMSLPIAEPKDKQVGRQEAQVAVVLPNMQEVTVPTFVPCLMHGSVLGTLLAYLTFAEWCMLSSTSRELRILLQERDDLREEVLERYLITVGYRRWSFSTPDPLSLSLKDLNDYMRGVSMPTHEYARFAHGYLQSLSGGGRGRDAEAFAQSVESLTASARAYTRVVLRLRAQAEAELQTRPSQESVVRPGSAGRGAINGQGPSQASSPPLSWNNSGGHGSVRAPSPAQSMYSQGQGTTRNLSVMSVRSGSVSVAGSASGSVGGGGFRSPLFRVGRAPLLRVFVPSPEGDWLSDGSVLRCEAELRNAGVVGLLRPGDVVWDIAVGDEGNIGRLVWDGSYLIDLDYTYSTIGDLPKYVHALAFPPSYFHKVIRTGPGNGNPVVHIDISPWGEEIAMNLQLLQDRIRTETPQGAYHNVVRWVNRSSFMIMPPSSRGGAYNAYTRARPHSSSSQMQKAIGTHGLQKSNSHSHALAQSYNAGPNASRRLVIPGTGGLCVDPGWYGTVVVEAEGTNEGLADLQARCPGVFPPRAGRIGSAHGNGNGSGAGESGRVFRILRERSRPGEIWIRTVREKERLL